MPEWNFKAQRHVYEVLEDWALPNGGSVPAGTIVEFVGAEPPKTIESHLLKYVGVHHHSKDGGYWYEYPEISILMWKNWIISRTPTYTDDRDSIAL